jgi:hypothetical protein
MTALKKELRSVGAAKTLEMVPATSVVASAVFSATSTTTGGREAGWSWR